MDTINYNYERHVRKNIKKAFRSNLSIYRDESQKGIEIFKKLYTQSMKQKHAKPFYFFSDDFFENLFNMFKDEVYLFHVDYNGKVICSSMELGKYGILHDYLRGTDSKYLELRPNDFLLDTVINWAKQEKFKYFSLGGGNTTKEDDSQYKFKKSFSSTTADFYVYKKIHNLEVYKQLCKNKELKYESAQYFPEYMEE
jgi:predicted N-acyltransferase